MVKTPKGVLTNQIRPAWRRLWCTFFFLLYELYLSSFWPKLMSKCPLQLSIHVLALLDQWIAQNKSNVIVVWTCKIMDCAWADLKADLGLIWGWIWGWIWASNKYTNVPIIWAKIDIETLSVWWLKFAHNIRQVWAWNKSYDILFFRIGIELIFGANLEHLFEPRFASIFN